jgi:hypothetical protein
MKLFSLRFLFPAILAAVLGAAEPARGQATAMVRGKVLDESGAVVPGAQVQMVNPLHPRHKFETETGGDGTFLFFQVPFNPYRLSVSKDGFQTYQEMLDVHTSALTVEVALKVGAVTQVVEVHDALLEETRVSTHITLDTHELERKAGASPSRMIEAAVLESAGVAQNANGRMHVRGAHYQVSFMIDGLPVSDQLSIDFANPFDMRNVEALEVYTGNFPAEFGNKVSGVVNVSTKSGLGASRRFRGSVGGSAGSFSTAEGSVQFGGGTDRWGYFASFAGGRSDRFLDPPSVDNLHNSGDNQSLFLRLDWRPTSSDLVNFSASGARSKYGVPNLPSQQAAGQDQRQRLLDLALRLSWLRVFSGQWSLEVTPYYRTAMAQLFPSPFDAPVTASASRHLTTAGAKAAVNYTGRGHRFKAGIDFFGFPVSEQLAFGVTDGAFNDPLDPEFNPNLLPHDLTRGGAPFQFREKRTGSEYSFFVQDVYTWRGFTASLGLRYDNYHFVLRRDHWSPRVGLAYSIAPTGTVLRASYNRLFQTPSHENLLFSTSPEAASLVPPDRIAELGAALLIVRPERVDFWEFGAQQRVKNWFRVDVSGYGKRVRDYHDNDQFLNTTIVFPIAIRGGEINGFDLRVDVPPHRGVSGYWTFSWSEAVALPPVVGGLFLGEEAVELLNAGAFRIDHDQTYTSQGAVTYDHRSGFWTSLGGRFDSGLPVEIEDVAEVAADPDVNRELRFVDLGRDPIRVKSRMVWDWSVGWNYPHDEPRVGLQFDIRNLTDARRLYNYLSVFSGTHVIAPRTFSGRMRLYF